MKLHPLFAYSASLLLLASLSVPAVAGVPSAPTTMEVDALTQALTPEVSFRYDYDFPMDLEGAHGDYAMQEYRAAVPLPPVLTEEFKLIASLNYRVFDTAIDTDVLEGDFDLHSFRLPIQAGWLSSSTPWVAIAYLEPGFSTDYNVLNGDSFDLIAGVGAGYRFSPHLFVVLGAGYSRNYGEDALFPGLVVLWKPCEHFSLTLSPDGIVPEWRINDDWRVKAKAELIGGRWTLEDAAGRARELQLEGGSVTFSVERRLLEKCWMSLGVGFNTLANLRIEDGNNRELLDRDLEEGLVLRTALKWVF
ncbi:MAG: DUF6268 family outer membrane beta-barrel protein [Roseimicrobium sp.]